MSDLKLKKITIRNWMRYADAEVIFPEKGLVLVTGINSASGGKLLSVGAGKTSLGEAIARTLLGSKGRFTYSNSYPRNKKGDAYVKVETEHRGVPFTVENGFSCKELGGTGEALRYQYGDQKPVMRSRIAETRSEISAILGVTPLLSNWTVFIRGNKIEFNELLSCQEDAVNLIMTALMQPPWTQFFERSKVVVNNFKSAVANDKNNHASVTERLQESKESVLDAEADVAAEEKVYREQKAINDARIVVLNQESAAKKKTVEQGAARKLEIEKRLKTIEDEKAEKHHGLEIKRNAIDDKRQAIQTKKEAALGTRSAFQNALETQETKLEELEGTPKVCPTCGKDWDAAHSVEEIEKQKKAVEKAQKSLEKASKIVNTLSADSTKLGLERREVAAALEALNVQEECVALSDEYAGIERNAQALERRRHAIELEVVSLGKDVSDANVKVAQATLVERKNHVVDLENQLKALAVSVAENEEALKVGSYWNKAFGPTGIPNMVLTEAIAPMNEVARVISHRMTGGTIKVTYGTTRRLGTGESKAELVVNVDNEIGAPDVEGSSNGESGLTNFIVSETLSEIGNVSSRIGFKWYDEVVPYQDPVVARSIYAYMRDLAHRTGILVFLVDHNPAAENYADYVLVVEKSKTGTTVAWR